MSKSPEFWWKQPWSPKLTAALTHINQSRKCARRDSFEQCVELSNGLTYIRQAASDAGATIGGEALKVVENVTELLKELSTSIATAGGSSGGSRGAPTKDITACARAVLLLRPVIELLFDNPSHRLALYGTLRRGHINHSLISNIPGEWSSGLVTGTIREIDAYPAFAWLAAGPEQVVEILNSEFLPQHYERIDKFEEERYVRVLVPATVDERISVCNIYETVAP
jgi:gamma-glutamylcyclotransferase (GGCT)/AIG2-like uncharacterized protein YtfP